MLKRFIAALKPKRSTRKTREPPQQSSACTNQRSKRTRGRSQRRHGGYSQSCAPISSGHGNASCEYGTITVKLDSRSRKKYPACQKENFPHSTQLPRQSIATVFEEQANEEVSVSDHQANSNTASPLLRQSFETVFEGVERSSTCHAPESDVLPPVLPPRPGTSTRSIQRLEKPPLCRDHDENSVSSTALSRTESIFDGRDDCSSAPSSPHKPTPDEGFGNRLFAYGKLEFPQEWPNKPSREALSIFKQWAKGNADAKLAKFDSTWILGKARRLSKNARSVMLSLNDIACYTRRELSASFVQWFLTILLQHNGKNSIIPFIGSHSARAVFCDTSSMTLNYIKAHCQGDDEQTILTCQHVFRNERFKKFDLFRQYDFYFTLLMALSEVKGLLQAQKLCIGLLEDSFALNGRGNCPIVFNRIATFIASCVQKTTRRMSYLEYGKELAVDLLLVFDITLHWLRSFKLTSKGHCMQLFKETLGFCTPPQRPLVLWFFHRITTLEDLFDIRHCHLLEYLNAQASRVVKAWDFVAFFIRLHNTFLQSLVWLDVDNWAVELFDPEYYELLLHHSGLQEGHRARRLDLMDEAERNQAEEALLAYGSSFGEDFLKEICDRFMDTVEVTGN